MIIDPTKHLLGYGRRDATTGMLHGHIRWPEGQPPPPFGCRWCGTEHSGHGLRWMPGKGIHRWEQPTEAQIKARMLARRDGGADGISRRITPLQAMRADLVTDLVGLAPARDVDASYNPAFNSIGLELTATREQWSVWQKALKVDLGRTTNRGGSVTSHATWRGIRVVICCWLVAGETGGAE